ncbi:YceH family protein [Curvibacter sp. HBC61]|uniref:YceH family protein n=1 Tax=Curvibacter cyanobacteriorum TaxID=3026422 RepID=A0ABT5N2K0_9BURK|nr:YceH family protein [Curvibacter sp. HBC61]MDD0840537.1 YceH family protein [Curvibacter sp. HBC61]
MPLRPLTPTEARVLGTLMEKARTVPDSYPLTLNAVVSGSNQKTSREPLMQLSDAEAQEALDELKRLSLVIESSGGRASRYEHNFSRVLGVPDQSAALLGLLMLRGPQTAGELRINSERWHRFADISSVEAFLDELQERSADKGGPLVQKLPRAPGAREQRWAHLLCGPVDEAWLTPSAPANAPSGGGAAAPAALQARVDQLEAEVASLRSELNHLCEQLGLSRPGQE